MGTANSKGPATPFVTTLSAAGASVGDLVVVCIGNITASDTSSAVTDSKSNVYTRAKDSSGANGLASVWFSVITTALLTTDTVSVTLTTQAALAVSVIKITGLPTAVLDGTDGNVGVGTSVTVGTTFATTAAIEAVICVVADKGPTADTTPTAGTGFTLIGRVGTNSGGATTNITTNPEDEALASITTFTAGNVLMTLGVSRGWESVVATFKTAAPGNPFKHSAGYLVSGGSKRLRRRASSLYYSQTITTPVLTQEAPLVQSAAAYFQTGTRRRAGRRVGFWHTIAQAVNTSWAEVAAPGLPAGEALITAGSQRLRRRARAGLLASSQTNAVLVSDSQISLSGQGSWRSVATTPARPNPPNTGLFLLVAVIAIPFKHSAGVLIQVYKWGRRISRRMAYWPIWVQQSRPLLTPDIPETKPGLVMVQWSRRRPRRRQGVWHGLGNQVNTVYSPVSAPLTPQSEALITASAKRLRRRASSSVTVYANSTTILQ
jgi:hypothetical protein